MFERIRKQSDGGLGTVRSSTKLFLQYIAGIYPVRNYAAVCLGKLTRFDVHMGQCRIEAGGQVTMHVSGRFFCLFKGAMRGELYVRRRRRSLRRSLGTNRKPISVTGNAVSAKYQVRS